MKPYLLIGAGGHAKVLIEILRDQKSALLGCLALEGKEVAGVPILGGDEAIGGHPVSSISLVNAVGGLTSNKTRRAVYERFRALGYAFPAISAPSAAVSRSAKLAAGAQVLTRAVVHPDTTIGENAVVNTGVVVEHDCVVGAHVFLGPGAVVCGGAVIEDGAFIEPGALILPMKRVGAGARVGAGTILHDDVPAGATFLGVQAKRVSHGGPR